LILHQIHSRSRGNVTRSRIYLDPRFKKYLSQSKALVKDKPLKTGWGRFARMGGIYICLLIFDTVVNNLSERSIFLNQFAFVFKLFTDFFLFTYNLLASINFTMMYKM